MDPSGTLKDGNIRVVLSWGKDPADLDLHCHSSKGEHVYFVRKRYLFSHSAQTLAHTKTMIAQ